MITRHDDVHRVTHYGAAPLVDHAGYSVEVGVEDGSDLMSIRVGLTDTPCHAIRADLPTTAVAELRDRCDAFLHDHQEPQ
ncbi:hypothetical protein [Nocardia farcinica]|uniref:hypothetical protein n=1 Tax=Nocardia farcinica TaxID=37329 RepID=UPI0024585EDC|nr:hypothetical protein [Nocardia farcinica]